mgnify:CR=1 FL=1
MSAQPNDLRTDVDSQETREWMDALSAVIESEGPDRAHFLLEQLLEHDILIRDVGLANHLRVTAGTPADDD